MNNIRNGQLGRDRHCQMDVVRHYTHLVEHHAEFTTCRYIHIPEYGLSPINQDW